MQETWAKSLGQEDPLQKEMATHSSILAWEIIWTEEPDYSSWSCKSVRHDLAIKQYRCIYFKYSSVYMYSVYLHVPVHPTPAFFLLVTISLFSKSIVLHFLDKRFSLLKSFLFITSKYNFWIHITSGFHSDHGRILCTISSFHLAITICSTLGWLLILTTMMFLHPLCL